uniref:Type IV secretion protein Rhs n=1 Tax=Heterorhabditis bacteriophora TaxID=37862 RepID=A0A1I7X2N3_HETBA
MSTTLLTLISDIDGYFSMELIGTENLSSHGPTAAAKHLIQLTARSN